MRQPFLTGHTVLCAILAVVAGLIGLSGCGQPSDPGSGDHRGSQAGNGVRGIVLITVDGLVADQLSIWGGPHKVAELERLASEGTAWRDAWTPCPMTRPAVASYLTGQAPDRHGVVDDVLAALPAGVPTLATQLGRQGFRTAAFPDSGFLGPASGLLNDFEVWDEPPRPHLAGGRWIPAVKPRSLQLEAFSSWIASLGPDERYFGWVHVSRPILAQLLDREGGPPPQIMADFEAVLNGVLGASTAPDIAVVVLGTFADAAGGDTGLAGVGYSLEERAVSVPVIARFPGGNSKARAPDAPVWGLDVTATLARLGGTSLPAGEGIDLFEPRTAADPMFTFSWATLDQMGWKAQRGVRLGPAKRLEGLETGTWNIADREATIDPELERRLAESLAGRSEPPRALVPLEVIADLLKANGLKLDPRPTAGREFGSHHERAAVTRALWSSRQKLLSNDGPAVFADLERVAALDPDNLAALLDRGQILLQLMHDPARGVPLLRRAVELYPGNPECLHWLAHALWTDNWQEGAKILKATLPYMPNDRDVLYDLACAGSLAGDLEASETYLRSAIDAGYRQWEQMEADPDLRHLRESGRFARVMQDYPR